MGPLVSLGVDLKLNFWHFFPGQFIELSLVWNRSMFYVDIFLSYCGFFLSKNFVGTFLRTVSDRLGLVMIILLKWPTKFMHQSTCVSCFFRERWRQAMKRLSMISCEISRFQAWLKSFFIYIGVYREMIE